MCKYRYSFLCFLIYDTQNPKPVNCLVTDHVHPYLLDFLSKKNIQYNYAPNISQIETEDIIKNYEVVIVNSKIKVHRNFIDAAQKLKLVGRLGSGTDGIDLEYLKSNNIHFIRTPEANANAVAEHAIGMLLALANKLVQCDTEVREKVWHREKNRGFELAEKTIGVVGFGNTGSRFATKMSALSNKVISYDKYVGVSVENYLNIDEVSMETLQKEADIISFHIPLTEETTRFINKAFFEQCKPGVILINTARGGIIHTRDLVDALQRGNVGGACLDVFENEKPNTFSDAEDTLYGKLYAMPNVILTPHVAGWSFESYFKIANVMCDKIEKLFF